MPYLNTNAYILVVIGILFAKCFGFLRDIVFASEFGASELTDIYFQVFSLASLVFTGIGSALSTLVIKNLNKSENLASDGGKKYVSSFISGASLIVFVAIIIMYIFSDVIVNLLLPGIDGALHDDAVKIMYIMLPSCLFVTVAYIISGVLQNSGVFFITSVMSLPYNAIIISSMLLFDVNITTVSVVSTIGWFLHIAVLLPSFIKKGYSLSAKIRKPSSKSSDNREVIYIFISSMMFQLVFMADKAAVSADSGAATTINYASNLFVTISSVFVVAMSNVSYPSICRHFESGDIDSVRKILRYIITLLLAIFAPFILTVNCFGNEIISLLYERGEFTSDLTLVTATLFAVYTFGIFGYVCQELLNKILYLDSKYKYTVAGTLTVVISKPFINMFAAKIGGTVAVAVCTAILFCIYALFILLIIRKTVGNYFNRELFTNVIKIAAASLTALVIYFITKKLNIGFFETKLGFIVPIILCAAGYIAVIWASGCLRYIADRQFAGSDKK